MPQIEDGYALLNVTYNGQNGDYPDPVLADTSDESIRSTAAEAISTGYIPGITETQDPDLSLFVVERFPPQDDLPARLVLRPKTALGG